MQCPHCHVEVSPDDDFCIECGCDLRSLKGHRQQRNVALIPLAIALVAIGVVGTLAVTTLLGGRSSSTPKETTTEQTAPTEDEEAVSQTETVSVSAEPAKEEESSSLEVSAPEKEEEPAAQEESEAAPLETVSVSSSTRRVEPSTFARDWAGYYEGYSQWSADGTIQRSVAFSFDYVGDDGTLSGVCYIGVAEEGDGATYASYRVDGSIDWETGEMSVTGTSWIDQGNLLGFRSYWGTVGEDHVRIVGSSSDADGHVGDMVLYVN